MSQSESKWKTGVNCQRNNKVHSISERGSVKGNVFKWFAMFDWTRNDRADTLFHTAPLVSVTRARALPHLFHIQIPSCEQSLVLSLLNLVQRMSFLRMSVFRL